MFRYNLRVGAKTILANFIGPSFIGFKNRPNRGCKHVPKIILTKKVETDTYLVLEPLAADN